MEVVRVVAPAPSFTPPVRLISINASNAPTSVTRTAQIDGEVGAALSLIIAIEVYGRSASDAKIAKLTGMATEAGRDAEAIRRVAEALVAALDPETRRAALMARFFHITRWTM